jgi:hypothetical protein
MLAVKPEGKSSHGRYRRRWDEKIKIDFGEIVYEGVDQTVIE